MLKKIIRKFTGDIKKPIIDTSISRELDNGYTSANLVNTNCLVVGSNVNVLMEVLKHEMAKAISIETKDIIGAESIKNSAIDLVGPYSRIFNVFYIRENDSVEQLQAIYSVLQAEVDYFVNYREGYTTSIVCAFIDCTDGNKNTVSEAVKNFVTGLGEQIGRHNIVINGLLATKDLDSGVVAKWCCILASKYGHVLTGDVVQLTDI